MCEVLSSISGTAKNGKKSEEVFQYLINEDHVAIFRTVTQEIPCKATKVHKPPWIEVGFL
jgi:N-acetylneuraminic acid mutarotase